MNTDDFHINALEHAVSALLSSDADALQNICERINQPQLNLCLVSTALSSSVECLKIVLEPLKGLYNASLDCLNLLLLENVDEERLKVLLPLSNPATVHPSTQHTLWSIGLLLKLPCSFYKNWNPDVQTVAEALPKMKECEDLELLNWCVKKVAEHNGGKVYIVNYVHPAWEAAQTSKNLAFLNILSSSFNQPTRWIGEIQKKWEFWETHCEILTSYPSLAALVVSVAIEKNNWKVVHGLIGCAEKNPIVTEACLATENMFACNWAFSQGFTLSAEHLWDQISHPEDKCLNANSLEFFKHLLECNKKWSMGAWEMLKQECGTSELFCQLLMHSEEAANLLLNEVDPQFQKSLPLRLASMCGHTNIVNYLLPYSTPETHNSEALASAALNGHEDVVRSLLPHSNSSDDNHRALACGLWHMVKSKNPTIAHLLITLDTPPDQTVRVWIDKISSCNPSGLNFTNIFAEDDEDIFGEHILHEITEDIDNCWGEMTDKKTTLHGNTISCSSKKTRPMSWNNFDQPITHWWSSIKRSDLVKIKRAFDTVFPQFLSQHLCEDNKSVDKPQRKI